MTKKKQRPLSEIDLSDDISDIDNTGTPKDHVNPYMKKVKDASPEETKIQNERIKALTGKYPEEILKKKPEREIKVTSAKKKK
jgi:hypothetical protein